MSRKTKLIVTLGPATQEREMIGRLIDGGVNVFRLNMSHANHEWAAEMTKLVRAEAEKRGKYTAVLFDLTGPSIRTGDLEKPYDLKEGDRVEFRSADAKPSTPLSTTSRPKASDSNL
jgi:pyruvate kinase